ncbi:MAG: EamA family transporter [Candidatus Paceibacterota bacterium]
MWLIFALLSAIFAALVAIFGKIGIANLDTTLATTVRSFIMFVFLLVVSLSMGKLHLLNTIGSKPFKFIVLSGVAGALSWLFYFSALKFGLASRVASVDRLSVVFVVLLAALFLGEALTIKSVLGVILLTAGAVLMII